MEIGTFFREAMARFTRVINVNPGQTFRLGWETSGAINCEVGAKRMKSRGLNGVHVNLNQLPLEPDEPLLGIQLAEGGWVNLANRGKKPILFRLPNTDEDRLRFTGFEGDIHRIPQNGVVELRSGESISTRQDGTPYAASWRSGDRMVDLNFTNTLNYSTKQPGVEVQYSLR